MVLEQDPDDPGIAGLTQAIADELLADEGRPLPAFVAPAMVRCVDSARRAAPPLAGGQRSAAA